MLGINGATALKAGLPEALVQALAEAASGDLWMKLATQARVSVTLEGRVRTTTVGEEVRRRAAVRIFGTARYGRIYAS